MTAMPEEHDEVPVEMHRKAQPGPEGHRTLAQRIRGNRRSLELTVFVFILFGISIFWTSHTAQRVTDASNQVIAKACDFWYPLTGLPVTTVTGQSHPTKLSIEIITGARESYEGQCNPPHPPMPPPDPSLVKWAGFYHIPVAR